ncbi:hypothetical protein ACPYPG_08170 [Streptomyces sp. FR-108]|uniref:hypothetical protein n=1 Tax=Streptomyces sp. FR-108 TaxID=3416665 RepID=UPI003CF7F8D7
MSDDTNQNTGFRVVHQETESPYFEVTRATSDWTPSTVDPGTQVQVESVTRIRFRLGRNSKVNEIGAKSLRPDVDRLLEEIIAKLKQREEKDSL